MEIVEFKYNVDEEVYMFFVIGCEIQRCIVKEIIVRKDDILYHLWDDSRLVKEDRLYSSYEECLVGAKKELDAYISEQKQVFNGIAKNEIDALDNQHLKSYELIQGLISQRLQDEL